MSRWSPEQVRAAAPDDSSLKAARKLATPGPWSDTGATEDLLWGRCQGSGKTPYQVSIDLAKPAFRCSCPSRKFPCKHGLALMMLWSEGTDVEQVTDPEAVAAAEEQHRSKSPPKAAAGSSKPAKKADPQVQETRRAARIALMDAGIEDFALWLQDLVRSGTTALRTRESGWFERAAARLVDAQCPTLAGEVRDLPQALYGGDDWNEQVLKVVGRWWTVVGAWRRREHLTGPEFADLRVALGWSWTAEEIRSGEHAQDRWLVLGVRRMDLGRVTEQRTWLYGVATAQTVVNLEFAAGGQSLPVPQATGACLDADLALYPGTAPRRARFLVDPVPAEPTDLPQGCDVAGALQAVADHLVANPLALTTPVVLSGVRFGTGDVVDTAGASLPLAGPPPWAALAATGGRPCTCFGELGRAGFWPLTVMTEEGAVPCG